MYGQYTVVYNKYHTLHASCRIFFMYESLRWIIWEEIVALQEVTYALEFSNGQRIALCENENFIFFVLF